MRLFAIVPILLAGCVIVEEPQKQAPPPGGTTQPSNQLEQDFDANVQPILQSTCNSCHGANVVGPTAVSLDYNTILATPALNGGSDPASSQLLTKGEHEGPAFTAAQETAILQWLEEAQSDGY
jgi:hypothetical protein